MFDFIFSNLWGWVGLAGMIVIVCIGAALFFPGFRHIALAVAAGAVGAASIYAKGQRDRAALEHKRKEEAVRRAQADYDLIERRPDTPSDAENRLRKGDF